MSEKGRQIKALDELAQELANQTPEQIVAELELVEDDTLARGLYPELFYGRLNILGENPRSEEDLTEEERAEIEKILKRKA